MPATTETSTFRPSATNAAVVFDPPLRSAKGGNSYELQASASY